MKYGGLDRSYIVHVPPQASGANAFPAILNFHGAGSNATQQERYSGMDATADRDGFVAVYPNGTGRGGRHDRAMARIRPLSVRGADRTVAERRSRVGRREQFRDPLRLGTVRSRFRGGVVETHRLGPCLAGRHARLSARAWTWHMDDRCQRADVEILPRFSLAAGLKTRRTATQRRCRSRLRLRQG